MTSLRFVTALISYAVIGSTAILTAHSTSWLIVVGLGSVFLVDKLVFQLLPWRTKRSRQREILMQAVYFVLGSTAFFCARFGIVPWTEAAFLGVMTSLTISVVESVAALPPIARVNQLGRGPRLQKLPWAFRSACLVFFAISFPYWHTMHPMHTVPKRGPDALGFAYEDVWLRARDGIELSAWLVSAESARANVIFCHGHGRNKGHVAGLLTTLHEAGCNVFAFDFRGHGDSPGHTANFGEKDVDDIRDAVAYLEHRFPRKPVLLVGISYGAAVSLESLLYLPEVRGVWSEGSFGWLSHAVRRRLDCVPAAILKPLVRMYYVMGQLDCGLWVPHVNPIHCLAGVRVPILFCHGENDELAPFDDALALYERYDGPKSCYWIPGGSHYGLRQRHREEYLSRFREFLDDCVGCSGGQLAGK
jgi:uncharacterized protein